MNNPLFDMSPYQSEPTQTHIPDWIDSTAPDPDWDESNSAPSTQKATDDAVTYWRSAAEFTITLTSGLKINVLFTPGKKSELSTHQFDFTGPISPTGFKSHLVLAVEAEKFLHPVNYAQVYALVLLAQLQEIKHQVRSPKRSRHQGIASNDSHSQARAQARQRTTPKDNSRLESVMPENNTPNSNRPAVEVVEALSLDEEVDRQRLELKVERAFYEGAKALVELRSRRLYRSTHRKFEDYCRDRFGFTHRHVNYLIAGSQVVENILSGTNGSHLDPPPTGTIGSQIIPTNERQVRPLTTLKPDEQCSAWHQAVAAADGKVPSSRIVKDIVERIKERDATPRPIPFQKGDVVLIRGLGNPELKKYDGEWALALAINEYSVTIALNGKDIPVKPQFLEEVDPKYWADIKAVNERITRLQLECELDPMDAAGLEVLRRRTCFTSRQIMLLERMENDYGVV